MILTKYTLDVLVGVKNPKQSYLDQHFPDFTPIVHPTTGVPSYRYTAMVLGGQPDAKRKAEQLQKQLEDLEVLVRVDTHLTMKLAKESTYWKIETYIPRIYFPNQS